MPEESFSVEPTEEEKAEFDRWYEIAVKVGELEDEVERLEEAKRKLQAEVPINYLSEITRHDVEIARLKKEVDKLQQENNNLKMERKHEHIELIKKVIMNLIQKGIEVNPLNVLINLKKFGGILSIQVDMTDRSFSYIPRSGPRKMVSFITLGKRVSEIKKQLKSDNQ